MYWLFDNDKQIEVRREIEALVLALAESENKLTQDDQLFPFVGRKSKKIASEVIANLSQNDDFVCDPFSGSGMIPYATQLQNRRILANEYELYTNRMSNAAWRLPENIERLRQSFDIICESIRAEMNELYKTICPCGNVHVLDSLFFDRDPLRYTNITNHERLGTNAENITYRGKDKRCPNCKRTEKHFDATDLAHLNSLYERPVSRIFESRLIENSRINLSSEFTIYKKLFPHRSMLALDILWTAIDRLETEEINKLFLVDVFLSIIPQAKYKDYRSKSQDLHCPKVQLREVNLLYRFHDQFEIRLKGLENYNFPNRYESLPIQCKDFRNFLASISDNEVHLFFTDPPWGDGNAYFEKAQLYHPWLGYSLIDDSERLSKEVVITDAPSRRNEHNEERWWNDMEELFAGANRVLKEFKYFCLMFRPIKATQWLRILNRLKFIARSAGFEPLLTIDIDSSDPSMRVQQSASYAFVNDLIMIFIKVPPSIRRWIFKETDIDQMVFQTAEKLQEETSSSFTYRDWRRRISSEFSQKRLDDLDLPLYETRLYNVFRIYCDEVEPGRFLTKHLTPFSGQLFDVPATERIFHYVPKVIDELTQDNRQFSYSEFILKLSQFLENGTRSLIKEVSDLDMHRIIETYAEPIPNSKYFRRRSLPQIPQDISKLLDLDPYQFEAFVAHLLTAQGFTNVVLAGRSGDRGVDVIAQDPHGVMTIVQCKQWVGNNVGTTPIQRLDSFARTRNAGRKILITTSDFSPQGRDEASITGTEIINGEELSVLASTYLPDFFTIS